MWQTHIMEGMQYFINKMNQIGSEDIVYIEAMKYVHAIVPRIPTFYFGNIDDVIAHKLDKTTPIFQQYPQYNKLPYSNCLFEGNGFGYNKDAGQYSANKRAILVDGDDNFMVVFLLNYIDEEPPSYTGYVKDMWVLEPYMGIVRIGEGNEIKEGTYVDLAFRRNHAEKIFKIKLGECMPVPLTQYPSTTPDQWLREAGADMTFMKHALLMLHCKNIVTEKVLPSEKLNKKRLKNHKLPFYSYHILKVVLPGSVGGKVTISVGTGTRHRLNFCMGHFKHYTEEKPLFGKHAGLFWWNEYARGNPELGKVEKEYHVEVKP